MPSGVAVLKMWFDTWKSLAIWSTVSSAISTPLSLNASSVDADALLLVGPIVGAPSTTTIDGQLKFYVPILIELDSKVSATRTTKIFTTEADSSYLLIGHGRSGRSQPVF